jgi:hypothetical protein
MEVLRPVELEWRISSGKPDLLFAVAQAIAKHMTYNDPHPTAAVAAHLPETEAAELRNKNRARTLDEAFDGEGVNEIMTDFGILKRSQRSRNKGTLLTLIHAPHATQNSLEEQLCD